MPIRPDLKALYPANWREISHRIRFERAGGKCERCGAPHMMEIVRSSINPRLFLVWDEQEYGYTTPDGIRIKFSEIPGEFDVYAKHTRVVLTTAHLDHNPANNDESNLAALCQRCHLAHDQQHHTTNRKRTLVRRKHQRQRESGQLRIWSEE